MFTILFIYSWFPVHTTSMNNTNDLISGDNKGYASYLMEQLMNDGALPGKVCSCSVTAVFSINFSCHRVNLWQHFLRVMKVMCPPTQQVQGV